MTSMSWMVTAASTPSLKSTTFETPRTTKKRKDKTNNSKVTENANSPSGLPKYADDSLSKVMPWSHHG